MIHDFIPVSGAFGNVTVAFAVLSYAGTLTITVVADRDQCPDLPILVQALRRELKALISPPGAAGRRRDHLGPKVLRCGDLRH